jgi:hypothetical protein
MSFKARLAAMEKVTPDEGFALVGVDDFDEANDPGSGLYVIDHFDAYEDAEKAKAARLRKNPEETLHIYPPPPKE